MKTRFAAMIAIALLSSAAGAQAAQPFDAWVTSRLEAIHADLVASPDFGKANTAIEELFGQVVLYAPDGSDKSLVDVAVQRRLYNAIVSVKGNPTSQRDLWWGLGRGAFSRTVAMLRTEKDEGEGFANAVAALRKACGDRIESLPNVAAALAVVHDQPLRFSVNENTASADGIEVLFAYYFNNQNRMVLGIKNMPADLLVHVVDASSPAKELQWALNRYGKDQMLGNRYFEINYDTAHVTSGAKKKVTVAGFNLPNILRYGGVCADQAYFAMTVGKAMGIPTAYIRGRSGDSGHAWLGFLQAQKQRVAWNFDEGRYEEFRNVRGVLVDPQTRDEIPDSQVGLLAEAIVIPEDRRYLSIAMSDAAQWMAQNESAKVPQPSGVNIATEARKSDLNAQLAMLKRAIEKNPANHRAWTFVGELAGGDGLSMAQRAEWADAVLKLCGEKYPDYAFDRLEPLIGSIPEVQKKIDVWNGAYAMFGKRPDLMAGIRLQQGDCYQAAGQIEKAGACYLEVIEKFANDGPFVVDALMRAEKALQEAKRGNQIPRLYQQAWSRIKRPGGATSVRFAYGNWYKVGEMLADRLDQAGMKADANKVRSAVNAQKR